MEARRVASILLLTFAMLGHRAWADVLLVVPESTPSMMLLAEKMQRSLGTPVEIGLQNDPSTKYERYAVAVLVGAQALKNWSGSIPAIGALISREDSLAFAGKAKTILYQEPPLERQLYLAKELLGGDYVLGVLAVSEKELLRHYPDLDLDSKNLRAVFYYTKNYPNLNYALNDVLKNSAILVGVANKALYNNDTIKNILITSYRQNKALIGPTSAYLSAGALASTYSNLDDVAQRLSEIIVQGLQQKKWPASDYNPYFHVVFNTQVARSLNMSLPDANALAEKLKNLP